MAERIEPRVLKGFRDFTPQAQAVRKDLIRRLEGVFELTGFVPIDTPVLEYAEILLGKSGGETEKQVYRFFDQGNRDIALRYDLTVPFARFMAQHLHEFPLPFRRYHIAKVWRGEKPHKGRYREFMQCDFDLVGAESASADFEILLTIYRSMRALGIDRFAIHISHRGILRHYLENMGYGGHAADILRTIDKLHKLGRGEVEEQLSELMSGPDITSVLALIAPAKTAAQTIGKLTAQLGKDSPHVRRVMNILEYAAELGIESFFQPDISITRGLDYYTGLVFETFLTDLPNIGSVCSGGRYDNLVSLFSKQTLSGVGASIGLDRLLAALEELKLLPAAGVSPALLILCIDEELTGYYHKLAEEFRDNGIVTEVFPEKKKLAQQFQTASKKGIPFALICGGEEKSRGKISIKDVLSRESSLEITVAEAVLLIKDRTGR
jgi:histidyl-tRNA synthetase